MLVPDQPSHPPRPGRSTTSAFASITRSAWRPLHPLRRIREDRPVQRGKVVSGFLIALVLLLALVGTGLVQLHSSAPPPSRSLPPSLSSSVGGGGNAAPRYVTYTNSRFGFTTLWPSSFKEQPPPTDGDGQAWASPDGRAELSAYGANNVFNYSPQQDEAADCQGLSVVYHNVSGNIVTVSGYKNSGRTIVYQRDVIGPGVIDTLYWRYPTSEKAQWDAAVTRIVQAFQPGDLVTAH